ncbi:MAG: VWA domain-containing protein, partial [Anaerolineales bacterium]|nr:VWA domain-containing protein [Anaerolineales bacterium]
LQLLILAALALALARPFLPVPSVISGSVVVLLDGSASMRATDVEPTRFDAAKSEVERLIGDLGGSSQMTIIKVGLTPDVLAAATGDKNVLRAALTGLEAETAVPDWSAAFALAAGAAQGFRDAHIVIISDGGLPDNLPPLPGDPIFIPIGSSGENLAITALATAAIPASATNAGGIQLFASVSNEGSLDHDALLSITLDGTLYDSRHISVPAHSSANTTWELPEGTGIIAARLSDHAGDNLPLDDEAWAVHEGGVSNRALLVTDGNLFLEQLYTVLPGIEAFKTTPDTELDPAFDLYVFDGVPLPDPAPAADMLIINPPSGGDLFSVTGAFSNTVAIRLTDNPLLQFVDWRNVHIREANAVSAPWAQVLVEGEGGPLILIGERGGHRLAILTFDLRASDLPLQIAFPILMANITGWLSPGRAFDAPTGLQPGEPVSITPAASTTAVSVTKPDGTLWSAEVGEGAVIFTETGQPGLYQVHLRDEQGEREAGSFAVNLFSAAESHIQPRDTVQTGQAAIAQAADSNVGQREFWPWLISIAFIILFMEWWVHHRGTQRPNIKFR